MKTANKLNQASVFVTTCMIGSTKGYSYGKWFNLAFFENIHEFMTVVMDYARTELGDPEPELYFSDYLGTLGKHVTINQWSLDPDIWKLMELEEEELKRYEAYLSARGKGLSETTADLIELANENYIGYFEDVQLMAEEYAHDSGLLNNLPYIIKYSLDYQTMAENIMQDRHVHNGYHFDARPLSSLIKPFNPFKTDKAA